MGQLRNCVGGDRVTLSGPWAAAGYDGEAMFVKQPEEACSWVLGARLNTEV